MTTTSSRLQLSFTAKGLKNLSGILQTSDPFAIVTVRGDDPDNTPTIAGYTNVAYNNLNPNWSTVIIVDGYKFGVFYFIEVGVFDFCAKHAGQREADLAQQSSVTHSIIRGDIAANRAGTRQFPHKPMGTAFFEIGEVLGSRGNVASKSLQTGGELFVHAEPSRGIPKQSLRLELGGLGLGCGGGSGSSRRRTSAGRAFLKRPCSPFFELYRRVEKPTGDVSWNSVFRSHVVQCDPNPLWQGASLDLEILCNGDWDRTVKICAWDYKRGGKHRPLGEIQTTVRGLMDSKTTSANPEDFLALREKDDLTVGGISSLESSNMTGSIVVLEAEIVSPGNEGTGTKKKPCVPQNIAVSDRPSFVDYLTGGCEIGLAVAIDFSAHNGHPGKPGSLHNVNSDTLNDYEKAIVAVGNILAKYDSDQTFPVWGFGAKFDGQLYNCFQCGEAEEVRGVDGIVDAYRSVFTRAFQMSSKPELKEVIRTAAGYATHQQEKALEEKRLSYNILLILTAGNVENIKETKLELNAASQAPLSVVIVGIGDADFSGMEFLDSDFDRNDPDITQFVRFNDYTSYNAITEAVLEEIPDQLVDYYHSKGILPGQAEKYDSGKVVVQAADGRERIAGFLG